MKAKILLQLLWSEKVGWDDPVPDSLLEEWLQWRSELHLLSSHHIPRCYYSKGATITSMQLHGFSDALRVGGRQENTRLSFDTRHPIILPLNHPLVKLLIRSEHLHLLHAGHLLTSASLSR